MTIKLEIHAPGLDLHHKRWNHHVLFMDSVHKHATRVAACAWHLYEEVGRGAMFVDKDQWMTIIKGQEWTSNSLFPCSHLSVDPPSSVVDTAPLRAGFAQMVADYDPKKEVPLLVEHHPGNQLSSYLMEPDLAPPKAADEMRSVIDATT